MPPPEPRSKTSSPRSRRAKTTGFAQPMLPATVEVGDVAAMHGQHDGIGTGAGLEMPVLYEPLPQRVCVVVGAQPAGAAEAEQGLLHVAVTQFPGRSALMPVILTTVLGQLRVPDMAGEGGEEPASIDLGQLLGVTDQYELPAGLAGVTQEPHQPAAPQHPGFVDHDDAAAVERAAAGVEIGEELVGGVGADPGARL
jgi:hypothetical protein